MVVTILHTPWTPCLLQWMSPVLYTSLTTAFVESAVFSAYSAHSPSSHKFGDATRCTIQFLSSSTSKFDYFTPTGSPIYPWTLYLLLINSLAVFKVMINPCFTANTATQGSWWQMLQLHAQALSRIKIFVSTSMSPFSHIQSHNGGSLLFTNGPTSGPPTLLPYLHRETPQTILTPPVFS